MGLKEETSKAKQLRGGNREEKFDWKGNKNILLYALQYWNGENIVFSRAFCSIAVS